MHLLLSGAPSPCRDRDVQRKAIDGVDVEVTLEVDVVPAVAEGGRGESGEAWRCGVVASSDGDVGQLMLAKVTRCAVVAAVLRWRPVWPPHCAFVDCWRCW